MANAKAKSTAKTQKTNLHQPKAVLQKVKKTVTKAGKKGGSAQMMGATAGAVVGATVGGIAGAVLSDKKTRRDMGQKITEFTRTAVDRVEKMSDKAVDVSMSARKSVNELANDSDTLNKKIQKN